MTLHIYDQVGQGSEQWHDLRRGLVTASTVGKLLTPTLKVADNDTSRGLVATLAAERVTGWTEPSGMTPDMWRGVESEPIARDIYSDHYAEATEVGFMVRREDAWTLGYSPDGLVGETGLIEVKAPRQHTHMRTVLSGQVPAHYMAQCQAGLFVSGREFIDWISYCGGMPLLVIRVLPDPKWFAAIEAAVTKFEKDAAELVSAYEGRAKDLPVVTERIEFGGEIRVA